MEDAAAELLENQEAAELDDRTSKIHRGRVRPRKIPKFGPDVPEIHEMFQKKNWPKKKSESRRNQAAKESPSSWKF